MSLRNQKSKALFAKAINAYSNGNLKIASDHLTHYVETFGEDIETMKILGICYFDQGEYEKAALVLSKVIKTDPNDFDAYLNLAICNAKNKDWEKAIHHYTTCVALDSQNWQAFSGLGDAYMANNKISEALSSYVKAIELRGFDAKNLLFKLSQALLVKGDWKDGFELFEYRTSQDIAQREHEMVRRWNGQALHGKKVLVECEQGFGDAIQFSRYLDELNNMGASLMAACPEPLFDLLSHSFPKVKFLLPNSKIDSTSVDFYIPIMSLAGLLNTRIDHIPHSHGYLTTPPAHKAKWAWLDNSEQLKVGLVWSGNPQHKNDKNRSIPFDQILKYLPKNIRFFSVQKNNDSNHLTTQANLTVLGSEINNFSDTAAICEQMDLVITVDTSIAHLCGALGTRTWLMLPFSPDWRWLLDRSDSVWYKSIEIFRQPAIGDWETVLKQINDKLLQILRT